MSKRRDAEGVQHSTGTKPKGEPSILDKAGYWQRWQDLKKFVEQELDVADEMAERTHPYAIILNKMRALE